MRSQSLAILLAFIPIFPESAPIWAHPLGNYSINQYFLVDMRETPPIVYYLVDMAEIPSFTELDLLDTDFDSDVTDEERKKYLNMKIPPLLANLSLTQNDTDIPLNLVDRRLALLDGQGGMVVFNILLKLRPEAWTPPEPGEPVEFELVSENYADESGVRECKLVLDNYYRDDTHAVGEDKLGYQTLVFLDGNENPVYQDFDAQFLVRLAGAEGEPITGDGATRIAFQWTSTAKAAETSGESALVEAMGQTVGETEEKAAPEDKTSPVNGDSGAAQPSGSEGRGEAASTSSTPPEDVSGNAPARGQNDALPDAGKTSWIASPGFWQGLLIGAVSGILVARSWGVVVNAARKWKR